MAQIVQPNAASPPTPSELVTRLAADHIPSDALVVRGYLDRSDIIDRLYDVLRKGGVTNPQINAIKPTIDPVRDKDTFPWRLYLSPKLDRYVEFAFSDMLAVKKEEDLNREDAYTVWLRYRSPDYPYFYTVISPLRSATGFIRGDLIEDFMNRPESRATAWDEQDYQLFGPPPTSHGCGGPYR